MRRALFAVSALVFAVATPAVAGKKNFMAVLNGAQEVPPTASPAIGNAFFDFDTATGDLRFINAGHNPPLLARANGTVEQLESGGLPLGIMEFSEYEAATAKLGPGDALVIYSDGVSEANNIAEEEFGLDRLIAVVKEHLASSASRIRDRVEQALSTFTGTAPANDDITLVIVKRPATGA